MRNTTGFIRRLFSKRILVLLLVAVIFISVVGVSYQVVLSKEDDPLSAVPAADATVGTAGEPINFSSNDSTGGIRSYIWSFGDGETSSDANPSHTYESPGWYNVSLTVEDDDRRRDNGTITVGIQRPDASDERIGGRMRHLNPLSGPLVSLLRVPCGPNIGNPMITGSVDLQEIWGDGTITVVADFMGHLTTLYVDSFGSTSGGGYGNSFEIDPGDIPEEFSTLESSIELRINLNYGRLDVDSSSIQSTFPHEEIGPPW